MDLGQVWSSAAIYEYFVKNTEDGIQIQVKVRISCACSFCKFTEILKKKKRLGPICVDKDGPTIRQAYNKPIMFGGSSLIMWKSNNDGNSLNRAVTGEILLLHFPGTNKNPISFCSFLTNGGSTAYMTFPSDLLISIKASLMLENHDSL